MRTISALPFDSHYRPILLWSVVFYFVLSSVVWPSSVSLKGFPGRSASGHRRQLKRKGLADYSRCDHACRGEPAGPWGVDSHHSMQTTFV